jgi:hypothetical protein
MIPLPTPLFSHWSISLRGWTFVICGIALTFSNRIYNDRYSVDRVTRNGLYQCNRGSQCSAQLLNLRTLSFTYRMSSGKNCTESVHFSEIALILLPEMTLRSLVPDSYILVSVSDLYIPTISLPRNFISGST